MSALVSTQSFASGILSGKPPIMTDAKPKKKTKIKGRTETGKAMIKIASMVNDVAAEQDDYTIIRLARKAVAREREVALTGFSDFVFDQENGICAIATLNKISRFKDDITYLAHRQGPAVERSRSVSGRPCLA